MGDARRPNSWRGTAAGTVAPNRCRDPALAGAIGPACGPWLMADKMSVYSPALVAGERPLPRPEDLASRTLLHSSSAPAKTTIGGYGSPPPACRAASPNGPD